MSSYLFEEEEKKVEEEKKQQPTKKEPTQPPQLKKMNGLLESFAKASVEQMEERDLKTDKLLLESNTVPGKITNAFE